jgi:tRNA threonylcarbamoyladenosine modification (KEOPS) complex Cgi121 subunit
LIFVGVPKTKFNLLGIGQILNDLTSNYDLKAAQLLDNRLIWGRSHILSAIWHARKAYQNNRMISQSFSMEILLYSAGLRQIKKAVGLLGVTDTTESVLGVLIGENESKILNACTAAQKAFNLNLDLDLLNNYHLKHQYVLKMLKDEGFAGEDFSYSEIENAIMQKISLLALE